MTRITTFSASSNWRASHLRHEACRRLSNLRHRCQWHPQHERCGQSTGSPSRSSLPTRRAACRRLRLIAWCRRQSSSVLKKSPTRPIEARSGLGNYCSIMCSTLNEDKLKNRLKGGDREKIEAAVQATIESDLFSRASTTRVRCLKHASRNFTWTTA